MKKNIFQIIGLLLLLPLFSGCNDSDDVAAEMFGFWESEAEKKKSMDELKKNGTYNVIFEGTTEDDLIKGNIRGSVITSYPLAGTWRANGKDNKFKANITEGKDGGDKLAKNFLEGLKNATAYEGDSKNLYLLYKPTGSQQIFRMVFYVVNQ